MQVNSWPGRLTMRTSKLFLQNAIRFTLILTAISLRVGSTLAQVSPSGVHRAALAAVAPVIDCTKLDQVDISSAVGARTHLTSSEIVTDGKPAAYCRVTGYVEPMVKFEVRLPLKTWTQRFVQTGCGGLCGNLNIRLGNDDSCYPAQHGELALSSTDMGHSGGMDGKFGESDYQLRIDFAYRGVHVTTLASKALIAAFYGQAPKYSYFSGCSDGGREALMEAQRYPDDFNGITAGAPAMNFVTQNTLYHGWNATKNTDSNGAPILTADKLPILHQAVLRACDALDGLKDGLISDPLNCHFDPTLIECKAGAADASCLTHAQVETARALYLGAHSANGDKLVLSGPLPGSELAWTGVYVPFSCETRIMSSTISTGTLKYLVYEKNPAASYSLTDLQYTAEAFAATTKLHSLYDATNPDLGPFAESGGKLILWHGLADPHISPLNTIAYYSAMQKQMGDKAVQQFARLYLFPGGYHCGGGEGPFAFDLMSAVIAWVENGTAPFSLVASHQTARVKGEVVGVPAGMPSKSSQNSSTPNINRTRPVYPYPLTSKYTGSGSPDDASNFEVGPAQPATSSQLQWLGSSFYSAHYEKWCKGAGASMSCTSHR